MSDNYNDENPAYVELSCGAGVALVADVEFLDVFESVEGYDTLRYVCPECGEEHMSYPFRFRR